MRFALLHNPRLLCERLAEISVARRRRASLRGTPAAWLSDDHIGSLELLRLLDRPDAAVIYDIGANVGTWTLLARSIFPDATVHAFEPLVMHHEGFARNTAGMPDVHLHGTALGESAGTAPMHVTSFSDASSLLPLASAGASQWHIHEVGVEPVPIERLEEWIARTSSPQPTLIKLDVQGFELAVLRGAGAVLDRIDAVIVEVSFQEFYEGQSPFHDVTGYLAQHGLTLKALAHGTPLGRTLVQADALFARQKARSPR